MGINPKIACSEEYLSDAVILKLSLALLAFLKAEIYNFFLLIEFAFIIFDAQKFI